MLKNIVLIAAALGIATPAVAQTNAGFVGPRVELSTGLADVDSDNVDYGLTVGFDTPVTDRVTFGVDADARNVFDNNGRDIGAGARLGVALNPNVLAFGRVGYTNLDTPGKNLEGHTLGAGLNFRLAPQTFANIEYRRSDYGQNVESDGIRLGIGLRF